MDRKIIARPGDVIQFVSSLSRKKQEHFGIVCLDEGKNVIGKKVLFIGCTNKCLVDTKVVFWAACKMSASGIILFHNHPTGNVTPSSADISSTQSLKKGCDAIGISLLDHVIVGKYSYFSFVEHNLIPESGCDSIDKVAE